MGFLSQEQQDAIYRRVVAEFACDHADAPVVRFVASNGVVHWRRQCLRCGATVATPKAATLSDAERADAPTFNPEISRAWQVRFCDRHAELRAEAIDDELALKRSRYAEYLESPEWARLRLRVLRRAEGVCEGCGLRTPTQVHHLTYDRIYREMLFDLVAVCRECHAAIHEPVPDEARA